MKIFEAGVIVGRFQHLHKGHERLINIGLSLCEKVVIFIGASKESNTIKNPYSYETRIKLLNIVFEKEILSGRVLIYHKDDELDNTKLSHDWGRLLLNKTNDFIKQRPNCIIYGKDKDIRKCFSLEDTKNITEVFVDRNTLKTSATLIRDILINDEKKEWKKHVNKKIHKKYDELRDILVKTHKDIN
ncbi:Bifunctional NMN adenylyltransferase/Nudix hydrolase [compost metagenome]